MKKLLFLTLSAMYISSCGEIVAMKWESKDPDEPPIFAKDIAKKEESKVAQKNEAVKPIPKREAEEYYNEEIPDIYERSVALSMEEVDILIRNALENRNLKILHIMHITKGLKEQGVKDIWEDMNVYLVCRLSDGAVIFKHNPQLLSQTPCRIYTYRKGDRIVIGMFKPSTAIRYMGNLDLDAIKTLKKLDKELKDVIDEVVSSK